MLKIVLISVLLLGLAVVLLCAGMLVGGRKKSLSFHTHSRPGLKEKGVECHHEMH